MQLELNPKSQILVLAFLVFTLSLTSVPLYMRTSSLADFSDFHTQVQATRHLGKAAVTIFLHPTIVRYPGFPLSPFLPDPEHTSIIIQTPSLQGSVSSTARKYHEQKKENTTRHELMWYFSNYAVLPSPLLAPPMDRRDEGILFSGS